MDEIAAAPVRPNSEDLLYYSVLGLILGVVVTLFTFYIMGFSLANETDDSSIFYQDLNKVEMKIGKYPIDPRVIESIHHFQKYPFGELMVTDDFHVYTRFANYINEILVKVYYTTLLALSVLFVCFCLFSYYS